MKSFILIQQNLVDLLAQNGIGQLRKDDLKKYKSRFELDQMKSIKKIFDPFDIFNPGKVF